MKVDKVTEVYVFSDVLDSGPFEGETWYNKAREYGRYDLCLYIAEARRYRALLEFTEHIQLYEKTGEQQYKDLATGRYYHRILWDEIVRRLRNGYDDDEIDKEIIIDELDLPKPYQFHCYACTAKCEVCPIAERAGQCSDNNSTYVHFVKALENKNVEEAITEAERMRDAWTR